MKIPEMYIPILIFKYSGKIVAITAIWTDDTELAFSLNCPLTQFFHKISVKEIWTKENGLVIKCKSRTQIYLFINFISIMQYLCKQC